ncbi:hypothetical protein PORY_002619 [Pneumocystis oryctolagi]|uniref:Uncharacterized protein n=1 Tax=Pneumocystis oryctolagi TaxID=42067 RepID=A0ACB7C8V3_9ASCO|nr:hypothetical protein PORY_002619 [Pneumocystis oryctolagi]
MYKIFHIKKKSTIFLRGFFSTQYCFSIQQSFTKSASERRIFSGIQPTGIPHIGNYLGALKQWVDLQNSADSSTILLFCIADLHAITISKNPVELKKHKREMFVALEAIGIDTKRSILYEQSTVPCHSELAWIFNCMVPISRLQRMIQWKTKSFSFKNTNSITNLGLLAYPVLQAADILLYKTTEVPVGEDQTQHLELTCTISRLFNRTFSENIFTSPKVILTPSKRIMSLRNPKQKMSKSDPDPNSRILITDSSDVIEFKISNAVTDSYHGITYDPDKRPGIANLLQIMVSLDYPDSDIVEIAKDNSNISHKAFKSLVANSIYTFFAPIRERYYNIIARDISLYIEENIKGTQKAQKLASHTMEQVKTCIVSSNTDFSLLPTEEINISPELNHNDCVELPSNDWRYKEITDILDDEPWCDYAKIPAKEFTQVEPEVILPQNELKKQRPEKGKLLYEKPENIAYLRLQAENEVALREIKKKYNSRLKTREVKGFCIDIDESECNIEDIDEFLKRIDTVEQINNNSQQYIQLNTMIENKQELEDFLDRLLD